ncbi:TIGR03364 family FAD-dependent oxidoreductase [Myceligenerans pegani]|uniref:TIGR03364 family FAD-dependent oxidoreductase n=1 Tax=Myceligenerans pegani TaxID=2776917 RepID=UPI00299F4BEE|nr:TIGR03364 family FAD-dependent oxidoreductase [Myceligenerans sp. TRM 65318]
MSRRTSLFGGSLLPSRVDLVIVGAGIVGLAHAVEAVSRGWSVLVVERDARAVGASVRNFGHIGVTVQDGIALSYALASRERWLRLGKEAGFAVRETGSLVVARADDELAVLDDFAARRDGDAQVLTRKGVTERVPVSPRGLTGGAFLPLDLRVDQRTAVAAVAAWLNTRRECRVEWSTSVVGLEPGSGVTLVRTSRGDVVARRVVCAVGHDVGRLFPEAAHDAGIQHCRQQMLRVAPARSARRAIGEIGPAVLTGTSMLRHEGFAWSPSVARVRQRLAETRPELLDAGVSLMITQLPDGTVTLGATHTYGFTHDPFRSEALDDLLLAEGASLLGVPLRAVERWEATYASAPQPFLVAEPMPGVSAVSVTAGIGMACAFGLAAKVVEEVA